MKRLIFRMCVFLLLGAVVNVAVAWVLVLRPQSFGSIYLRFPTVENPRSTLIYRQLGEIRIVQHNGILSAYWFEPPIGLGEAEYRQMIPFWSHFRDVEPVTNVSYDPSLPECITYAEHASGWPSFSLRMVEVAHAPIHGLRGFAKESDGLELPPSVTLLMVSDYSNHHLPVRPLPGFAINTFFYATILWLLFAAPGRVRRWRRIPRGLCARCAYPVGACDVCTECGAAVRRVG